MTARTYLSIGDVLSLLRQDFPDVTISKIRFLESQGLVNPERSPSGYRKFHDRDVARLKWVLRQQREHFLPLKVIRDRLEKEGDAALETDARAPVVELHGTPAVSRTEGSGGAGVERRAEDREDASVATLEVVPGQGGGEQVRASGARPLAQMVPTAPGGQGAGAGGPSPDDGPGSRGRDLAEAGGPDASSHPVRGPAESVSPPNGLHLAGGRAHGPAARGFPPADRASVGVPSPGGGPSQPAHGSGRGATGPVPPRAAAQPPSSGEAARQGTAREPGPGSNETRPSGRAPRAVPGPEAAGSSSRRPEGGGSGAGRPDAAPSGAGRTPLPAAAGGTGASMTAEELCRSAGLESEDLVMLERFGLIEPMTVAGIAYYDEDALTVAGLAASLRGFGVEPRHLRLYRNAVDRELGLIEQIITPLLRQRNPDARRRAADTTSELVRIGENLRSVLLGREVRRQLGG